MMSLGNFLLEKRRENKNKMQKGLKQKYIGKMGELFALNYLENLFDKNNIRNYKILPHNKDYEEFDLEIYINGRKYKFEVKFSTIKTHPNFDEIHFNNNFDYLFLIWFQNDEEIYLAILTKKEAKEIATPINTNREDDDNWKIGTTGIFDENLLNRLSMFLELDREIEDLDDEEKSELIEDVNEEIMKNPKAVKNDFNGETYQEWIYQYLSNFTNYIELMPRTYKYDLNYKGKGIEIKYSALYEDGEFHFRHIKINNFEYILFVGFNKKENKFYFEIKSKDEFENWLEEHDINFQQNGIEIGVKKSFFRFGNDFTFEDFDNYIESH